MFDARGLSCWCVLIAGCVSQSAPTPAAPGYSKTTALAALTPAKTAYAPSIAVTPSGIELDGALVGHARADQVARLEFLREALEDHPPTSEQDTIFGASYRLAFLPGTNGAQLKSAVRTAAFSGWANAELGLGDRHLVVTLHTPRLSFRGGLQFREKVLLAVMRRDRAELWRVSSDESADWEPVGITALDYEDEASLKVAFVAECKSASGCQPGAMLLAGDAQSYAVTRVLSAWADAALAHDSSPLLVSFPGLEPVSGAPQRVRLGTRAVLGQLLPVDVETVVGPVQDQLSHCYELGVSRQPTLPGQVVIHLLVGSGGEILDLRAAAPGATEGELIKCMAAVLGKVTFPEPKPKGGIAMVPLAFKFR